MNLLVYLHGFINRKTPKKIKIIIKKKPQLGEAVFTNLKVDARRTTMNQKFTAEEEGKKYNIVGIVKCEE